MTPEQLVEASSLNGQIDRNTLLLLSGDWRQVIMFTRVRIC